MKALIEIPDSLLPAIGSLCKQEKISRVEMVRRAVKEYVTAHETRKKEKKNVMAHFGAWKNTSSECDGVELQRRLRSEWTNRDSGL